MSSVSGANPSATGSGPASETKSVSASPTSAPSPLTRWKIRARVQAWIDTLHNDPSAEERAAEDRRQRLLDELNRAVSEAPDDVPIRSIISRLNHHADD